MPGSGGADVSWQDVVDASMCGTGIVEDGRFTYVNEWLADLHGLETTEDLVDESWSVLVAPTDREWIDQVVLPRVREAGRWTGTVRGQWIDSGQQLFDLSVDQIGSDAFIWSVRQATLDPSKPDSNPVRRPLDADSIPMGICSADGEIRYCNGEAVDFLGADDRGEILERDLKKFVTVEDWSSLQGRLRRTIGRGDSTETTEHRVVCLDGEDRVAKITTAPVTLDGKAAAQIVFEDVTERTKRERFETIIETVEDGIYATDDDLRFTFVNDGFCELVGLPREDILGAHGRELYVDEEEFSEAEKLRERLIENENRIGTIHGTFPTSTGDRIFESRYRLYPEPVDEFQGSVGIVRDVTEREERQRALERQRDELAAINRINELLFDIVNELVESTTREGVERTVCEQLAQSDLYRFVWIGRGKSGGEGIDPRNSAGDDNGYLASIALAEGGEVLGGGPAGRAIRTGEALAVNVDSMDSESLRVAASEQGFESILAVPLCFRETMYGVLVVCATRRDAFNEREQHAFAVLGETVGYAVHESELRRLLFANATTEIELQITAPKSFLSRISEQVGCRLTVSGHVRVDDQWVLYVDVDAASAERIADVAAEEPNIDCVRVLTGNGDAERLELNVSDSSIVHQINSLGVGFQSLEFDEGVGHLVAEAPLERDVRELVEQYDEVLGSAELLALQELDRHPKPTSLPLEPDQLMTDRQRQVLEAAYRAGYFARPRNSRGEEVAESMGISTSTFHAHLRKAEQSLISSVFH